ncbi:MAG TPA: thiamine phosphate synthase [Actinomycetota bacterium]|nr:thiamine phosphate synthase [Actinomycetota bacterium]
MTARRERLDAARLYLVCGGQRPDLDEFLEAALTAGVDVVQLREKQMEARPLLEIAARFRRACDRHGALLVINDRPDLAIASNADGVHLGQDDLPPAAGRALVGNEMLIGRSTHAPDETRAALSEPVDYICVGPVHATPTKPGRSATGLDLVRLAAAECAKPWFAIGGLDPQTAKEAAQAGATRIVVVRAIEQAADVEGAVRALRSAIGA